MAYCIMVGGGESMGKRRRHQLRGIEAENNRDEKNDIDFPRSKINWSATHKNKYYAKSSNWNKKITDTIKKYGAKERKDSVVALDFCYSASPEFFDNKSKNEIEKYFQDCLNFHKKEYCQGNSDLIVNAILHYDETTPHLHVVSVPLLTDEKGVHLNAKRIIGNLANTIKHQDNFFHDVGQKYGLQRGKRINHSEQKVRETAAEYRTKKAEYHAAIADEQAAQAEQNAATRIEQATKATREADAKIQKSRDILQKFNENSNEVNEIKKRITKKEKSFFEKLSNKNNDIYEIGKKDLLKLIQLAKQTQSAIYDRDNIKQENNVLLNENKKLIYERDNASNIAKAQAIKELESKHEELEKQIYKLNNPYIKDIAQMPTDAQSLLHYIALHDNTLKNTYHQEQSDIDKIIALSASKVFLGKNYQSGKLQPNKALQAIVQNAKILASKYGLPQDGVTMQRAKKVIRQLQKQKSNNKENTNQKHINTHSGGIEPNYNNTPADYNHEPQNTNFAEKPSFDLDTDEEKDWNLMSELSKDEEKMKRRIKEFG